MEEKKHCKWYNDEFCTNDKSPCVADYCPVVEYPELCKFREVAEDINVPNKDEKTIEFDDDVVDLLVEFDEMGFTPTTTCPDPEEYAKRWKKSLLDLIHRLQSENAKLKTELRKECEEHEEFTKKAKAELEELHTLTDMHEANVRKMFENNMSLRKEIEQLTTRCEIAEGTKNRLTIFDRIEIHDKAVKEVAKKFATSFPSASAQRAICMIRSQSIFSAMQALVHS